MLGNRQEDQPLPADPLYSFIKPRLTHPKLCHGLHGRNFASAPPGGDTVKVRIFLRRPAAVFALLFGDGDTLALALEDILAFEFRQLPRTRSA